MGKYIRPRGTLDLFENEASLYQYIQQTAFKVAKKFNYKPIVTPTFESTSLFSRSTGESSDIVTKEMYNFKDKGDRDIALRPEGTAGVIRAVVENKLYATNDLPLKYYYAGSFFRYERPQVGRYREFMQFGVEIVGTNSYLDDCETILYIASLLKELNLKDYRIRINTFGNVTCRNKHRDAIKDFFGKHIENLCEDCQKRYVSNPLRILDCKVDKEYIEKLDTPVSLDSLDEENKLQFENIKKILDSNHIKYEIDKFLVRGLDYYTGLIFEVDVTMQDGKVLTIGGGGRYSSLVKELEGPDLSCVGFGLGINRIALILSETYGAASYANKVDYYIMPLDESLTTTCIQIASYLRNKGFNVVMENAKKSIGSMFKYASRNNIQYALMVGEDEIKDKKVKIKNLQTQEQFYEDLSKYIED